MTRLAALVCPACQVALAPLGAPDERVLCCAKCPTAVDVAHDGLARYELRNARAGDGFEPGLYWALAGDVRVGAFAATEPAQTSIGTFERADQVIAFALHIPISIPPLRAHAAALELVGKQPATTAPAPTTAPLPAGILGRREAERVAHQVAVTLVTRAPGKLHKLELTFEVRSCSVLRVM